MSAAKVVAYVEYGADREVFEALAVIDGSGNIHVTEYGNVASGSSLGEMTFSNNEGRMQMYYTPINNYSNMTVFVTAIA
jgi:hypothetical protein